MKYLQDFFETLPREEFDRISTMQDKKSLNPQSQKLFFDSLSIVYCAEMGVEEAELTTEEMDKLIDCFNMSAALYTAVREGHMRIVKGRIKLTDNNSASFQLTKKGINHVEKNLLGK